MTTSLSLLQTINRSQVLTEPFPHVVIENALPDELHTELRRTFPSRHTLGVNIGQNERWSTSLRELREIAGITDLWRNFVEYHASRDFLNEVLDLFGESIVELYPRTFESVDDIRSRPVVVRGVGLEAQGELHLDSQVSGNTPATQCGVPRGIHFDSTESLWAGLYYLRSDADDSSGGDLELWKWPDFYSFRKKSSLYREGMNPKYARRFRTIPYKSNTFVFLINSIDSLHSVTERFPTPHTRQFLNLVCSLPAPLFRPLPLPHIRLKNLMGRTHQLLR
jgi:hypothetical protein